MRVALYGIDPGLVDTGIVGVVLDTHGRFISMRSSAVSTPAAVPAELDRVMALHGQVGGGQWKTLTTIEGYRNRGNAYNTDKRMATLVQDLHRAIPGSKILDNMGVKKVVTDDLLATLRMLHFQQRTHHQDLRSAARIALLAGLKDPQINEIIAQAVIDHEDGHPWVQV